MHAYASMQHIKNSTVQVGYWQVVIGNESEEKTVEKLRICVPYDRVDGTANEELFLHGLRTHIRTVGHPNKPRTENVRKGSCKRKGSIENLQKREASNQ